MKKKVTIVDYGLGNIVSAQQSFLRVSLEKKIDAEIQISSDLHGKIFSLYEISICKSRSLW